ncbi:hypothetical protein OF83DRAFT_1106370 [Amylostereum chailletii]|nr:hypothetical protein OF83DRAFT_1106370 [Amylostereum chailletii]
MTSASHQEPSAGHRACAALRPTQSMDVTSLVRYGSRLPAPLRPLVWSGLVGFSVSPAGLILSQLIDITNRLRGPHPARPQPELLSNAQLDEVSYDHIDMMKTIPREPTQKGYVIIGGSGFVGAYIVRLLLMRGERNIRILDMVPPPQEFADNPSVKYLHMDMTVLHSVREGLLAPFPSTGVPPSVVIHAAAVIRFWERTAYAWSSSEVNVTGTANILEATKSLSQETLLIYTSTADIALPRPRFMQLGKDYEEWPWNTTVISDNDPLLNDAQGSSSCYTRSKSLAERLVMDAHGSRLRTASLRPGQTITGPNDRFLTGTLTMPRVPIFDKLWSHTNVCVWDVAAAHLNLEDALQRNPDEVGGQAYLITGKGPAWTMEDSRNAVKHYSNRPLDFKEVHPLLIFFLAHIVEAFLFLRYHFLLPFFFLVGSRPRVTPRWMGELVYLQPATLEFMRDAVIDDSRAQVMLGWVLYPLNPLNF